MSNKYIILELLKEQELTIKEIAEKTQLNENKVRTYIFRLKKDNLVKEIGKKNRYIIYTAIEKEEKISPELKNKLEVYHKLFEMIIEKYGSELDLDIQNYILNHNEFAGGDF